MLKVNVSGKFKKDLKVCSKRGYNLKLLEDVVTILRIPEKLPQKTRITTYQEITKGEENAISCRIGC